MGSDESLSEQERAKTGGPAPAFSELAATWVQGYQVLECKRAIMLSTNCHDETAKPITPTTPEISRVQLYCGERTMLSSGRSLYSAMPV